MKKINILIYALIITPHLAFAGNGGAVGAASFNAFGEGKAIGSFNTQVKFQDLTQEGELIFDIKNRDEARIQRYRVLDSEEINEQMLDALEESYNNNKMWQSL